jgi:site-specific DNA-methyltransferase (adenine-specific)
MTVPREVEEVLEGKRRFAVSHCDDAYALLRALPSEFADHCITDPPYSEHCQANMMSGTTLAKVDVDFGPLTAFAFANDLVRVAKRWAIAFCTIEDVGHYADAVGPEQWIRGGVWYKPNSMGQLSGDRPAASYECLAIMHRDGKKRWNGRGSFAHWVCNGTRGEDGRHDCQKPLKLLMKLVEQFTDENDVVVDPFCGSGRTGEACLLLGRRFLGWDRDREWVSNSTVRLAAVESMSTYQAARAGQVALFGGVK